MNRYRWAALVLLGLLVVSLSAAFERVPGYMDAEYYTAIGMRLASGEGFSEPFIWNYLDDPSAIPHPSNLYWMPLPSMLAAGGMLLFGDGWRAAQLPFILLGGLLPVLTAFVALRITHDDRTAWLAGLLAVFPGFFLPYLSTVDSFAIYAVLGSLILLLLAKTDMDWRASFLAGLMIALAHLTRADGIVFFLPAGAAILSVKTGRLRRLVFLACGYLLGIAPWWVRNLQVLGTLMPNTSTAFWFTAYNDLFAFPADQINFQRWLASGWAAILEARLDALIVNSQRVVAEIGMVLLFPFSLVGGWSLRKTRLIWLSGLYFIGVFGLMTVIFPFAGANGGMFHSGAALLPVVLSLAPVGIERIVTLVSERRKWRQGEAVRVFQGAAVTMMFVLTMWITAGKLGTSPLGGNWSSTHAEYQRYGRTLAAYGLAERTGAVNNPPGYFLANGGETVVIPDGDVSTLQQVVQRYDVAWVLLEANHPPALADLYRQPDSLPWLERLATVEDSAGLPVYLYAVIDEGMEP